MKISNVVYSRDIRINFSALGNHLPSSNVKQSTIQKKRFLAQERSEDHPVKVAVSGNNEMFRSKLAIANVGVSPRNRQLVSKSLFE